jgi:hypothetical protein
MLPPNITTDSNPANLHAPQRKSYIIDVILGLSGVALLVIGILASSGTLQFMGTANANCLSYGMYTGAALCFIAEIIRLIITCKTQSPNVQRQNRANVEIDERAINNQITKVVLPSRIILPRQGFSFARRHFDCKIKIILTNGQAREVTLVVTDAYALLQAVDENKWFYDNDTKCTRLFFDGYGIQPSDRTAKELFERIMQ